MAASMVKGGHVLATASNCIFQCILFKDALTTSRILTCHLQVRERRRTCAPPGWHVKKKTNVSTEQLTWENQQFLKELAENKFKEVPSPLKEDLWPRGEWDKLTRRTGVLGVKLGVIPQWGKNGKKIDVTLYQIIDNHVIRYIPPEKFSTSIGCTPYWRKFGSVVVGALSSYPQQFRKEYNNLFLEAGVPPKRKLTRFLVTPNAAIQPGTPLSVMHFRVGDFVDVQAKTIGHGFQGVVKRWKFTGGRKSHGNTKAMRRTGAIGQQGHSRVMPGKKMPGHMGMDWNIQKGIKILRINTKYNVLYLKGHLPGPVHCYTRIYDTALMFKRRDNVDGPPMPTFFSEDTSEQVEEEYFDDEIFQFSSPSIKFEKDK
ncbi:large ribosomal subunit protein uL3m-like [Ylistrum balloti]|uniref:large ribosomal subunit protein uL3m-like n=1 Tax=Ylistrum balloti TaxID=509963 RepID=UPI002905B39A|nr:large ribosomal subunit protein uL3m-like [Ylistrum balloti]